MDTRLKDNEWIILHAVWQENPIDLKSIIRYVQEGDEGGQEQSLQPRHYL